MRWIGWLLLGLVVVGWLAAKVPAPETPAAGMTDVPWRRTRHGWQQATWLDEPAPRRPALHPGVVAGLQLLVSVMALAAFAPVSTKERPPAVLRRNPSDNIGLHRGPAPRPRKNRRNFRPA